MPKVITFIYGQRAKCNQSVCNWSTASLFQPHIQSSFYSYFDKNNNKLHHFREGTAFKAVLLQAKLLQLLDCWACFDCIYLRRVSCILCNIPEGTPVPPATIGMLSFASHFNVTWSCSSLSQTPLIAAAWPKQGPQKPPSRNLVFS